VYVNKDDYYAAGGPPGSAGVFMYSSDTGSRLMAIAGEHIDRNTWHTIQHEGFHQFIHAVIGGELPIWANEGFAEYFGESIFTGDGFVTGVVPPYRLQRLKEEMAANELKPIPKMMMLNSEQWIKELSAANYDQAWSMVYYLIHSDNGKLQKALGAFMVKVGHNEKWERAWLETLGPADQFEPQWKAYWQGLPESPTPVLYAQATVATLTSFLSRATDQKQTFADFDAFKNAATTDSGLKISQEEWLPHSMVESALRATEQSGTWALAISSQNKQPTIAETMEDGTRVIGSYVIRGGHVISVGTMVDDLPRYLADAKKLGDEGKKPEARAMIAEGIKKNPKSQEVAEAKALLSELK
jgi:hypothetical protein